MKLYKTTYYSGYEYKDIIEFLTKNYGEAKATAFKEWFNGQTVAIYKKKSIVYDYDLERFLAKKPPLD